MEKHEDYYIAMGRRGSLPTCMADRYCQVVLVRLEELIGVAAISLVCPCVMAIIDDMRFIDLLFTPPWPPPPPPSTGKAAELPGPSPEGCNGECVGA